MVTLAHPIIIIFGKCLAKVLRQTVSIRVYGFINIIVVAAVVVVVVVVAMLIK